MNNQYKIIELNQSEFFSWLQHVQDLKMFSWIGETFAYNFNQFAFYIWFFFHLFMELHEASV